MEEYSSAIIAEAAAFIALCTVAILLRFWSRSLLPSNKFQADDWTALAAYPFVIATLAVIIAWADNGLGQHVPITPVARQLETAKKVLWNTGITLSRITVLLFYRRLFENQTRFNLLLWVGIGLNVAWWLLMTFYNMFGCNPPQKQYDDSVPGTCLPELSSQILSSLTSFVLDVYILVIPFPYMKRLQMRRSRKITLTLIFLLGYAVPVLSLGRMIVTIQNQSSLNTEPNWGFALHSLWGDCEISISFIGVTIPCIWTLLRRGFLHGPSALFNDRQYSRRRESVTWPGSNEVASLDATGRSPTVVQNGGDGGSSGTSPNRENKDLNKSWYSPV